MNIVFHHPLPLDKNAKSASGIRPLRMLAAFNDLGCQVDLVTGYAAERRRCISKIKKNIKQGKKYDFVYSESSTMPTVLTEPHHLPLHPLLDWFFFKLCKNNNIPIGLFYRDIYWIFENYGTGLNPVKATVAKVAYRFDLRVYETALTKLYLPSQEMGKYIPHVNPATMEVLPPGHVSPNVVSKKRAGLPGLPLKLFYVGGMSSHYQLHKLFSVVRGLPQVELTICTREAEWQAVKKEYPILTDNIRLIHKSGLDMEAELLATDMAVLFVKPQEYWEFASPVKLYEYLGFNKPILASEGTLAGQFVRQNDVGWSIPYEEETARKILIEIAAHPEHLYQKTLKLQDIAPQHSWQARAQQVIKDLTL